MLDSQKVAVNLFALFSGMEERMGSTEECLSWIDTAALPDLIRFF
jgi:hypothetical protein|tara:strand:- start:929 stop:1063 length:135 start_codon:yes stop_codon:yes gene_type:complete